jgi:hypothetical protein
MILDGIVNKITGNIDDVGKLIGFAYGVQNCSQIHGTDFMFEINSLINSALNDPHMPNISHVVWGLTKGENSTPLKNSILVAIIGEILNYAGFGGKWANILKKGGWNVAMGIGIHELVKDSTWGHSPGGSNGSDASKANQSNSSQHLNENVGAY